MKISKKLKQKERGGETLQVQMKKGRRDDGWFRKEIHKSHDTKVLDLFRVLICRNGSGNGCFFPDLQQSLHCLEPSFSTSFFDAITRDNANKQIKNRAETDLPFGYTLVDLIGSH